MNSTIKDYKDLDVWKTSIELVKRIYLLTKKFPKDEMYGMVSQMRRAAVSIPSNIAEGKSRQSINEYIQFLYIAAGSTSELETLTIISEGINYIDKKTCDDLLESMNHISRMLRSLIKGLRASAMHRKPFTVNRKP